MSTNQSLAGYSLADLYTRIFPGALILIPIILAISILVGQSVDWINLISVGNLIGFAILALLFGEIINYIANGSGESPEKFNVLLYSETGRKDVLGIRNEMLAEPEDNKTRLARVYSYIIDKIPHTSTEIRSNKNVFDGKSNVDLIDALESDYNIRIQPKDSESDSTNLIPSDRIYHLILSQTWSEMSPVTRRYFYLNKLISNLRVVFIITTPLSITYLILGLIVEGSRILAIFAIILILFTLPMAIVPQVVFSGVEDNYVTHLLDDYYLSRPDIYSGD